MRTRRRRALRRRRLERLARAVAHLQAGVFADQAEKRTPVPVPEVVQQLPADTAQEVGMSAPLAVGKLELREELHDASEAPELKGPDGERLALLPGAEVRLRGLMAAPELNGVVGYLQEFHGDRGRWAVILPGAGPPKLLRPQNLAAARGMEEFHDEHLRTTATLHGEQPRTVEVQTDEHRHATEALTHGELLRAVEALTQAKTEHQDTIETLTDAHLSEKAALQQAIEALSREHADHQREVEALGKEGAKQKRTIDALLNENRRVTEALCTAQAEHQRTAEDFDGEREDCLYELTRLERTIASERDKRRELEQMIETLTAEKAAERGKRRELMQAVVFENRLPDWAERADPFLEPQSEWVMQRYLQSGAASPPRRGHERSASPPRRRLPRVSLQ